MAAFVFSDYRVKWRERLRDGNCLFVIPFFLVCYLEDTIRLNLLSFIASV